MTHPNTKQVVDFFEFCKTKPSCTEEYASIINEIMHAIKIDDTTSYKPVEEFPAFMAKCGLQ